ncbi:MAG TPA: xanthine dehydrogenase family protein molybdopterin-binding subunit [Acidimicrobiia bacterium]|nr:xanthine dehydrogenase family protein molybdopterin-binding subunit [Acidimicrobiia bacterium]
MPTSGSILGNAVRRTEDPRILSGEARYFDDMPVDGLVHVAFVRSTVAHATIESIDTSEAAAMPGVVAVYTAADLELGPLQGFAMVPPVFARPPLASERVRFVGDMVAAVVAETRAQAVDAAELVIVDYDPLPAVVDPEAALEDGAPILFPDHGSNIAIEFNFGEDPTVFDGADVVVEGRFVNQRLAAVPMEPNGILVELGTEDHPDGLTLHVPTQNPHGVRDPLAEVLGLEPEKVRVVAPAVGGGFGAKAGLYPEHVIAAAAARKLGRPVKWAETRSENMVAMNHGRGQIQYIELGLKRDGTIVGLRGRVVGEAGAYPNIGGFLPFLTRSMAQGVYRIPKIQFNSVSAATNTTTTGAYRGAGRPEAAAMLERIIDMAAAELEMDPVEIRKHNFLAPDEFPLTTVTGANYDVGEYARALDEATRVAGYEELRREQAQRREQGDAKQLGIGVSCYVEVTAGGLFQEFGSVEVHDDGTVTATVGTSAHGQGHETAFAMIVAELLGVPMESVRLVQSDTALVPRGTGTMGSRSLQTAGSALYRASEGVLEKAKRLAAHLLEANVDDIVVHEGGTVGVAGVPATALEWSELARAAHDDARRPDDMEPGLASELDFNQGEATYPFGAHVAVVEVDTETGRVELIRHIAVDDCGRILNPLLVTGQQHGGIAQGVAQALFEGVVYDDDGNPLTGNLMDYAMPSAAEFPSFEASNTETPTPLNPLGAKGIGESGTIGSTPAVQNAVVDALSVYGVRHLDMPLTAERVWRAIQDASATT